MDNQLNILFLCGSLQPGADGIGDYTRRLASELSKHGYTTKLLAYSDRHTEQSLEEFQNSDNIALSVLRLPKEMNASEKSEIINRWLGGVQPEWVSIQYVLYAFNDKGLPFDFAPEIQDLFPHSKFQVMFHELWLGMEKKPVLKDTLYGKVQNYIIAKMMKRLKPKVIHTHSRAYLQMLVHHGYKAIHLPIISNIPVIHPERPYIDISNQKNLSFLIFGFISPGAPVESFAKELRQFADNEKRQVQVVFAGRNGAYDGDWYQAFKSNNIECKKLGVLSVEALSDLMNDADIGISTTPFKLYEKSGSVAAMFKHGLPVLNVAVDWEPEIDIDFEIDEPITEYKAGMLADWLGSLHKPGRINKLETIANKFIEDLKLKVPVS